MKRKVKNKPQILKGFRDFLPQEKKIRDQVLTRIINTFKLFSFEPIETPSLEYASLLLGKYGQEADKLVYTFKDRGGRKIGLRYDQTVPTARVLTQHAQKISKFFRRYQIQNVFRADKPQKGRYREFTQCDIDIFGSNDPISDAEVLACTYFSFKNIGFKKIKIKINDRQILFDNLKNYSSAKVSVLSLIQSIDKLDKKTSKQVQEEIVKKGLTPTNARKALRQINSASLTENLKEIKKNALDLGVPARSLIFTPTLARGLDYYTGMIFEIILSDFPLGSFGGGGRYDNLIKDLGGPQIPAVGVAFGFDRIIEAVKNLKIISTEANTKVLITIFSPRLQSASLKVAGELRQAGINTQVYPSSNDNISKQLKYASKNKIPFIIILGEEEIKSNKITLKNMATGKQLTLSRTELIKKLR